jgi:hypothetical protein
VIPHSEGPLEWRRKRKSILTFCRSESSVQRLAVAASSPRYSSFDECNR